MKVHAVEKNANAIVTLRHRASSGRRVARPRRGPPVGHAALGAALSLDCVVSELLGSFGDNELSPECLEPVERWTGVSIPQNYESFLQPISCARLWFDARRANTGLPAGPPAVGACIGAPPPDRGLETPFVVKLHNFAPLSAVQPAFRFDHPASEKSLERYCALEFPVAVDCTVHGLAGYFESGSRRRHDLDQSGDVLDGHVLVVPAVPALLAARLRGRGVEPCGAAVAAARGRPRVAAGGPSWGPTCAPVHNPGGRSCAMRL